MNTKFLAKIPRNFLLIALSFAFYNIGIAATPPSQVTGVEAKLVGDNSVNLTWEEAISEEGIITGYRIYYGTQSVQNEGEVYENDIQVGGDRTTYPIENLQTGKTYYFAVTAEDDELNQSLNYSEEVSVEIPVKEGVVEEEVIEEHVVEEVEQEEQIENPAKNEEINKESEEAIQEEAVTEPEKPAAPIVGTDVIAPVDVVNLIIDKSRLQSSDTVTIRWQKSTDLDGDVADQIFYVKRGGDDWDQGYSIGKDLEEMVFDVQKDVDYQIRITTVDDSGNHSQGTVATFSTETLATSGPGMLITFAIVAVVMFFFLSFRRRT